MKPVLQAALNYSALSNDQHNAPDAAQFVHCFADNRYIFHLAIKVHKIFKISNSSPLAWWRWLNYKPPF